MASTKQKNASSDVYLRRKSYVTRDSSPLLTPKKQSIVCKQGVQATLATPACRQAFAGEPAHPLRLQRQAAPSPSGESELSRPPRHTNAVDGDSDRPLPHTHDATARVYSTAHVDIRIQSELRTQEKAAPSSWELRQHLGAAALVTSNLLTLPAMNVLVDLRSADVRIKHASHDTSHVRCAIGGGGGG